MLRYGIPEYRLPQGILDGAQDGDAVADTTDVLRGVRLPLRPVDGRYHLVGADRHLRNTNSQCVVNRIGQRWNHRQQWALTDQLSLLVQLV